VGNLKRFTSPYFPSGFRYATILMLAGALFLFAGGHWIWGSVLVVVSVIILTSRYVTEIHTEAKRYDEHISVMGIRFSPESTAFERLNKIVVTKQNFTQTMNSRVQSAQHRYSMFTATLLHDASGRLELISKRDREEVLKEARELGGAIGVPVDDRTVG
jgi:hypothetical protein